MTFISRTLPGGLSLLLASTCLAQSAAPASKPALPPNYGIVHLETNVGSFKILTPGANTPAEGTVEMTFKGTVLVSGLREGGKVTPGNGVRLEYDRKDRNKAVYFGNGKLLIEGKWDGVQFFGQNLHATYTGMGILRLYGEFDKKLDTGFYWYGNSTDKKFWGTGGTTITTRPPDALSDTVKVRVKSPAKTSAGKG